MHKFSQRKILHIASIIYVLSLISLMLIIFPDNANPLFITLAFLPFIISQIIPSNILVPICLNFIPNAKGRISAVLQGTQLIFSALSVEIAGYFYQGSFRNIGIIIVIFIMMAIITHFLVMKNAEISKTA